MKTYGATNPEQIAALFDMRGDIAGKQKENAATKIGRESYLSESLAWRAAADIIRNTEFVGWSSGKPVGDIIPVLDDYVEYTNGDVEINGILQTATAAAPVVLTIEAASVVLAALERPQAVESTRKYPFMREQHEAAISAVRSAIANAGGK